jgi:hypothetical protein
LWREFLYFKATTAENHISSIKNILAKAYNVIHTTEALKIPV